MKRTELRRKTALARGEMKRRRPKREAPQQGEQTARDLWNGAPLRKCANCGRTSGLERHHAIRRQRLERLVAAAGWARSAVWTLNWLIPLCKRCHARHTTRVGRLPLVVVPASAWVQARALDEALVIRGAPQTAVLELEREYS